MCLKNLTISPFLKNSVSRVREELPFGSGTTGGRLSPQAGACRGDFPGIFPEMNQYGRQAGAGASQAVACSESADFLKLFVSNLREK